MSKTKIFNIAIFTAAVLGLGFFAFSLEARATTECNDGIDNDNDGSCDYNFKNCSDLAAVGHDPGCESPEDDDEFLEGEVKVTKTTRITHPAFATANVGGSGGQTDRVWNYNHTRIMVYEGMGDCLRYPNDIDCFTDQWGTKDYGLGRRAVWAFVEELKPMDKDTPIQDYYDIFHEIYGSQDFIGGYPFWSPLEGEENIIYAPIDINSWRLSDSKGGIARINLDTGKVERVAYIGAKQGTFCTAWSASHEMYCSLTGELDWSDAYIINIENNTSRKITDGKPGGYCDPKWKEWPYFGHGHGGWSPSRNLWADDYGHSNEDGVYLMETCNAPDGWKFVEDMGHETTYYLLRDHNILRTPMPLYTSHVSWHASEGWFIVDLYGSGGVAPKNPNLNQQGVAQVLFDGSNFKYKALKFQMTPHQWDDGYKFISPAGTSCTPNPSCTYPYCFIDECKNVNKDYPYCDAASNKCYNQCIPLMRDGVIKSWDPGGVHCDFDMGGSILPVLRKDGKQVLIGGITGQYSYEDYNKCKKKQGTAYACSNFEEIKNNWAMGSYSLIDLAFVTGFNLADVNGDGHVNIKDIQICIKGIIDRNSIPDTQLQKCQAVAPPIDVVNIKDIQAIIQAIVNPS